MLPNPRFGEVVRAPKETHRALCPPDQNLGTTELSLKVVCTRYTLIHAPKVLYLTSKPSAERRVPMKSVLSWSIPKTLSTHSIGAAAQWQAPRYNAPHTFHQIYVERSTLGTRDGPPLPGMCQVLASMRPQLPVDAIDAEFLLDEISQFSIQDSEIVIFNVFLQKLLQSCSNPTPNPLERHAQLMAFQGQASTKLLYACIASRWEARIVAATRDSRMRSGLQLLNLLSTKAVAAASASVVFSNFLNASSLTICTQVHSLSNFFILSSESGGGHPARSHSPDSRCWHRQSTSKDPECTIIRQFTDPISNFTVSHPGLPLTSAC